MAWKIEYDPGAVRDLGRLDRSVQREIIRFLEERVALAADPRNFGKPLARTLFGLWRYRVRDFRVVCEIQAHKLVVLVVTIGHRSRVYED